MIDRRSFVKAVSSGMLGAGVGLPGLRAFGAVPPGAPSDEIRVGVIGAGSRGKWMMQHMLRVPGVRIAALCDVYEPRLDEGREVTGEATPAYRDYRRMLDAEGEGLDAVLVASPLRYHGDHMLAAVERGLHVYGEKSMAFDLEECNRIAAAVQEQGVLFQVGHQHRYAPWARKAVELIHAGEIGEVTHVYAYWHRNNNWRRPVPEPSLERLINWRLYLEYSRGLLAELGSHHIDLTNWAFGEVPTSVMGSGGIMFYDDGRETFDHLQTIFTYPSGRKLFFSSLLGNHQFGFQVRVLGTGGSVEITLQDATLYHEPWRPNSAVPVDWQERAVPTGATLSTKGDMPAEGNGLPIEGDEPETSADLLAVRAFFECLREGRRPFADERVGWESAVPVAFGHQAVRESGSITFGPHVPETAVMG